MGTKKWSEIKKLSKATEADRAEARAELEDEHSSQGEDCDVTRIEFTLPWKDQLAPAAAHGHTVAELLPPGFDCYVRVFHPFVSWGAEPTEPVSRSLCGRWVDIARSAGVRFGPNLTWRQLEKALPVGVDSQRPYAVWEGDLEINTADALFAALPSQGADGYFLSFGLVAIIRTDAHAPATYFVQTLDNRSAVIDAVNDGPATSITTAEYVWPTNRSWIVCTDCDLTSTYVALSREAACRLLTHPEIEAVEVDLNTRIDDAADEQIASSAQGE
jgi:hypothetical protein